MPRRTILRTFREAPSDTLRVTSAGKHIERLVRRIFLGSLRLLPRRRGAARDLADLHAPRILLVRPDRIGDALISTPVIALLRDRFPDGRIDILLGAKNISAAPLLDDIDEAISLPTAAGPILSAIRKLRAAKYDVAINLLAKDSASGLFLTAASGAAVRIGFEGNSAGIYDVEVAAPSAPMHIVRATSLLLVPLGIAPIGPAPKRPEERLRVRIPRDAHIAARGALDGLTGRLSLPILLLNISGSGPEKYWGREHFIELARRSQGEGLAPVIASAPADAAEAAAIAVASGAELLPPVGSFAAFAAMLEPAWIIVTPDTSVVHLSAALGKPTVMLVGSESVGGAWSPWGVEHRVVPGNGAIAGIEPSALLESIRSLAAATRPAHYTSSAP